MKLQSVLLLAGLSVTISAQATNGYFRLGYGQNSIAMAGTGSALGQDGFAAANNPATIFDVEGTYTVALSLFNPQRGFEVEGGNPASAIDGEFPLVPGKVQSDSELFYIPGFAYQRNLNDKLALNLSVYGNGGMNTDYSESVFYAGSAGVDLNQLFINTTIAYKLSEDTQVGVSPIIGVQSFEAKGIAGFGLYSQDASKVSDNGHDTVLGYGVRVGFRQKLNEQFTLGASYQSTIDFEEFEKYSGLFAESGDFDIPSSYNLGVAYEAGKFTVAADYQKINYSETASVANPLAPNIQTALLGSDNGAGFGWNDMEVFKLGGAYQQSNGNVIRAGVSYGEQPIDSSEVLFNILAPGVQEWHYSAGYEFKQQDVAYAVTFVYSPSKSVRGANLLFPSQQQFIELEMEQYELTFAVQF